MWTGKWGGVPGVIVAQGCEVCVELLQPQTLIHPFCEVDGKILELKSTEREDLVICNVKLGLGVGCKIPKKCA